MPDHIVKEIQRRLEQEAEWENSFGRIKPIIHTSVKGRRFVAVHNSLFHSDKWKTFPDFLFEYIWHIFGGEWLEAQRPNDPEEQHIVLKWYRSLRRYGAQQRPGPDGIVQTKPNGAMSALLLLSYDLYTVSHNFFLAPRLMARLRNNQQFQGARYELFAMCALLRGGFSLQYEEETDRSRSHSDFIATHVKSGHTIAVEAKSKHRRGTLATPGTPFAPDKVRLGKIASLINDAVNKDVAYPLVVFVDVNLPPEKADLELGQFPRKSTIKLFDSISQEHGGVDLFNFILFTNHPHHYGRGDQPDQRRIYSGVYSVKPKRKLAAQIVFDDLIKGALQYGNIPQHFDSLP